MFIGSFKIFNELVLDGVVILRMFGYYVLKSSYALSFHQTAILL